MSDTYKSITLLNGSEVTLLIPYGHHYSRAIHSHATQKSGLDIIPFLMSELCLVDGKHKSFTFFTELLGDDYLKIQDALGEVVSIIR